MLGLDATRRILATAGMDMLQGARTQQSEQLFGFVAEPPTPPDAVLNAYACATVEEMDATIAELQSAFAAELALLG